MDKSLKTFGKNKNLRLYMKNNNLVERNTGGGKYRDYLFKSKLSNYPKKRHSKTKKKRTKRKSKTMRKGRK